MYTMFTAFRCEQNVNNISESLMPSIKSELDFIFSKNVCDTEIHHHTINGHTYQNSIILLEGNVLFSIARRVWREIEAATFDDLNVANVDVVSSRQQIVDLLVLCRSSAQTNPEFLVSDFLNYLKLLKVAVTKWTDLDEKLVAKLVSRKILYNEPLIYHYFHMYLDINWIILTLNHVGSYDIITLDDLMSDIVVLQYMLYKKQLEIDFRPFVCPCVKQLLVLLTFYSEKCGRDFWDLFNNAVKDMDDNFSLWFLSNVAQLQAYNEDGIYIGPNSERIKENHALLESKLKKLVINDDTQLLNCLKLVDALLNEWWVKTTKSDAYQILWEIVYKNINNFTGLPSKSASDIVEFIDTVAFNNNTTNSYQYFLYMLIGFLTRFPNQWPKIRGRIYCKLPPHKINDYSDSGLLNIVLLYMSLMRESLREMSDKLLPLLGNLMHDRRNSPLVINAHVAVLILYVRQGFTIVDVSAPLTDIITNAVENRDKFFLVRVYIEGFDTVLKESRNFNLEQRILIGKWIPKYIPYCQFDDLCYFLNVLLYCVKEIRSAGAWNDWQHVFYEFVLTSLKSVAVLTSSPSQVGELAAAIDPNPLSNHLLIFTADTVAPKIACQYMTSIFENVAENYHLPKSHENAILHAWTRCCLLNCENIETLTRNVMKISALVLFNTPTNNPLCSFIKSMGKSTNTNLQELCEQCFGHVDASIGPCLVAPSSEAQSLHIYTCMALLFYHCAPLLYHKQRSNCLLNRLISLLLLPMDVLIGKPPHPHILSAVQRTWHLFVQGIFALHNGDPYIDRTLRDLVVRYIPFLQINDTPILKCLHNENLAAAIFSKIGTACLSQMSRTGGNATKALKIIQICVQTGPPSISKVILDNTLSSILEIIIFHTDKSNAIEIVKLIHNDFREPLKQSIILVTEKHLAFNSNNYFQFANMLAKIIPEEIREVLPNIKKQVVDVERRRGVGYDNTLRQALDRLVVLTNTKC